MSQHDYTIGNQSAPNARADINNALAAIVSQNSGATEPASTYANMLWYDSSANILKMRNESDSAWITLATLDQAAGTATAPTTIASQAEAEGGTENTKTMTPLRVAESIAARSDPTHLAIGSYAVLLNNSTAALAAGTTYAGSGLLYGSTLSGCQTNSNSGTAAPGVWRLMGSGIAGRSQAGGGEDPIINTWYAGLFVRTS
tara:strand:+ start:1309 stop:1911 length:603 start_codon:yes stop_codon:yes gene_type:complete